MKMLVCLHGNPLNGQEFDPLLPYLQEMEHQVVIHKRPIKSGKLEPLIQSINATVKVSGGGPFSLLAYSAGAYLALAYLKRFPENVTSVFLINPYLVIHKPLSLGVRTLHRTPLVRTLVLKLRSKKIAASYIDRLFEPAHPPVDIKKSLHSFLSHSPVWRGEAAYKKLMAANPLTAQFPGVQVPVHVLFGGKDQIALPQEQMKILKGLEELSCETIPEAGHALPWTHPMRIRDGLKQVT